MSLFNWVANLTRPKIKHSQRELDSITEAANISVNSLNRYLVAANNEQNQSLKEMFISQAKSELKHLKSMATEYSFLRLVDLENVEKSIAELDSELISSRKQSEIRKNELRNISVNFGSTKQECPYCSTELATFPQRKSKCKSCHKSIYSRKEPISGEKRLFKEEDLILYDELKELSLGSWDWWNANRLEIQQAKLDLASEWGIDASKISDADAKWRIITVKTLECMEIGDWSGYKDMRMEGLRQLDSEGKKDTALPLLFEYIYLAYNVEDKKAKIMGDEFKWLTEDDCKIHPPQLSVIDSLVSNVEELNAKYTNFMTNSNLPSLFDGNIQDAFDSFSNERHQYHQSLKSRSQ